MSEKAELVFSLLVVLVAMYVVLVVNGILELSISLAALAGIVSFAAGTIGGYIDAARVDDSQPSPTLRKVDTHEMCASCGEKFDTAYEDHGEIVDEYYCRDCAEVGKAVMENYREWLDTTEDIRQDA